MVNSAPRVVSARFWQNPAVIGSDQLLKSVRIKVKRTWQLPHYATVGVDPKPEDMTIEQSIDAVDKFRVQKAEIEKKEKAYMKALQKKAGKLKQKIDSLNGTPEVPGSPPVISNTGPAAPPIIPAAPLPPPQALPPGP